MDFYFVVSWQKMLVKVLKHMEASKGHNNICAARPWAILLWDENGFNRVVASVQFKQFLVLLALSTERKLSQSKWKDRNFKQEY